MEKTNIKNTFGISDEELTDIMMNSLSKAEDNCNQCHNNEMEKETDLLTSKEDKASLAWANFGRFEDIQQTSKYKNSTETNPEICSTERKISVVEAAKGTNPGGPCQNSNATHMVQQPNSELSFQQNGNISQVLPCVSRAEEPQFRWDSTTSSLSYINYGRNHSKSTVICNFVIIPHSYRIEWNSHNQQSVVVELSLQSKFSTTGILRINNQDMEKQFLKAVSNCPGFHVEDSQKSKVKMYFTSILNEILCGRSPVKPQIYMHDDGWYDTVEITQNGMSRVRPCYLFNGSNVQLPNGQIAPVLSSCKGNDNVEDARNYLMHYWDLSNKKGILLIGLVYTMLSFVDFPLRKYGLHGLQFVLNFKGETMSGKTTLAKILAKAFWQDENEYFHSADSTLSTLDEFITSSSRLRIVDDFYPKAKRRDADSQSDLENKIVRWGGNQRLDNKRNINSAEQVGNREVFGGILITSERTLLTSESAYQRTVFVDFYRGTLLNNAHSLLEENPQWGAAFMTLWIKWFQNHFFQIYDQQSIKYQDYLVRNKEVYGLNPRLLDSAAIISWAIELLVEFAERLDIKLLKGEDITQYVRDIFKSQIARREQNSPRKQVLQQLKRLIRQNQFRIGDKEEFSRSNEFDGFVEDNKLCLMEHSLFSKINSGLYSSLGGNTVLLDVLVNEGVVVPNKKGEHRWRSSFQRMVDEQQRPYMISLNLDFFKEENNNANN